MQSISSLFFVLTLHGGNEEQTSYITMNSNENFKLIGALKNALQKIHSPTPLALTRTRFQPHL